MLGMLGLVKEITGHVSVRVPGEEAMLLRCRGDRETGVQFTTPEEVRRVGLRGEDGDLEGGAFAVPLELPIHGKMLMARPDINCVVHAHPPSLLLCGLAGIELRPIFGAYDPQAMNLALDGIAVFPRSILVNSFAVADELEEAMRGSDVCLMRGHGITVLGRTVEEATIRAIKLESLAQVTWQLAASGRTVPDISTADREAFAARERAGGTLARGEEWLWRHYSRLLADFERRGDH
jgi:3,4-dihydroxyphthalate decarboxylase